MIAYLIDPHAKTVEQVEYNGDYQEIYKLIDANTFDVARLEHGDGIFVDDDGLMSDNPMFFKHRDYQQPLVGKGLVLGCDYEGNSISPACTLEQLREKVSFGFLLRINNSAIWIEEKELV